MATNSYLLAMLAPCPAITTVYDLVAFERSLGAPTGSAAERATLPLALRRARALVCISEATRELLLQRFPRADRSRIHAVPLGVDPRFFDATPASFERPYILMTGTLEPRKNIARSIEAVAPLADRAELVLAGPRGWRTDEIDAALADHAADVRALGHVPEAELPGLYAGAEVFLYPSLQEGFGLPVLEAMAAGAPVVTSNVSSLPEVGGDAVRYVDPLDVGSIRAGVAELLSDEAGRARLRTAGPERARQFSWARTARETLDLTVA
jgi:alpha-1,3-rhamnosyl/mannosyltransferase